MKLFDKKTDRVLGIPLPFFMIGVLVLGCIAIIPTLLTPKTLSVRTIPEGAQVFGNALFRIGGDKQLCKATPCEVELNRFTATIITIRLEDHYRRRVMVNPTEVAWDRRFEAPIKLRENTKLIKHKADIKACEDAVARGDYGDRDGLDSAAPQPCYRTPPTIPRRAKASGHCHAFFTVSETGRSRDIDIRGCTDHVFKNASRRAVRDWRYYPALDNGKAVSYADVEAKITFKLSDHAGTLIPEPEFNREDPDHAGDKADAQ